MRSARGFHIFWGAVLLIPLALKNESHWLGRPIRSAKEPVRFWLLGVGGVVLIAMGTYEAWHRFYVR